MSTGRDIFPYLFFAGMAVFALLFMLMFSTYDIGIELIIVGLLNSFSAANIILLFFIAMVVIAVIWYYLYKKYNPV